MADFNFEDIEVISEKLLDGRRVIRIVHTPTNLFVEDICAEEPHYKVKARLLEELRVKVAPKHS